MFNQIKWRLSEQCPRVHSSEPYATSEAAIVDTGPLLLLHPFEIWIQCANGDRIESAELVRQVRSWDQMGRAANA